MLTGKAAKSLDEICAAPTLPAPAASTRPAGVAPLESLQLFAKARIALDANQRMTAIRLLDEALALDPESFELNLALGQAASGSTLRERALPALKKAAAIQPDNADVYIEMAQLQVAGNDDAGAIHSLRIAQQTSDYKRDAEAALAVDYYLARTLQMADYDSAALGVYRQVLDRMSRVRPSYRGAPEIMQAMRAPDLVFSQIAILSAQVGEFTAATRAIEQAMLEAPHNRGYATFYVRLLLQSGHDDRAREFLPMLISRFGADDEIVGLLRESYAHFCDPDSATRSLRASFEKHPDDANLGYALADLLQREGDMKAASDILHTLATELNYRQDAVDHLFDFYESRDQMLDAAQVLIEASARRPEQLSEIATKMSRLVRLSRSKHLRLRDLQNLRVDSWAESARLYWVARLGAMWDRDEAARAALEKAVRSGKAYAPAYRMLMNHYWSRQDWDQQRKLQSSRELTMLATMNSDRHLAAELRGMVALRLRQPAEASAALLDAMRNGSNEPDVLLAYASVQQLQGNATEAQRTLLRITEDFPLFEQAYTELIQFHLQRGSAASAMRTLHRWLQADPRSATARLYEGAIFIFSRRTDAAEKVLLELFDEYADNGEVLIALQRLYAQGNRLERFIRLLEEKRELRPDIREVAERLVAIYAAEKRLPEARRVLSDLHKSAAGDSDLLYYVYQLYSRIDDKAAATAVLEEVLKVDPMHSAAANDLGYFIAEGNGDLDRAERLISIAVLEEPDNQAYLDSLGWVLYKRGRFDEARIQLERALAQTINPDPIVQDHLGDALYRASRPDDAVTKWVESEKGLQQLQPLRSELLALKLQLRNKLRQVRLKQRVQVAPTAAEAMGSSGPRRADRAIAN